MPTDLRHMPACDGCGGRYRTLFDAFQNDRGFVRLCAGCADPARGPARPYTGPYPIRAPRAAPALRLVAGGAAR
ncbi:MAG: hypothetical protein VX205_00205 [Pseudomonadota bacterium]|nr:hypothetical protein [Pseudomonadota bacterium]